MSFKVQARTLLQLGAELISSDAVALFELIKNAFDAGSPGRKGRSRRPLARLARRFSGSNRSSPQKADGAIERLRSRLLQHVDSGAPGVSEWEASVHAARKANDVAVLPRQPISIPSVTQGTAYSRADPTRSI